MEYKLWDLSRQTHSQAETAQCSGGGHASINFMYLVVFFNVHLKHTLHLSDKKNKTPKLNPIIRFGQVQTFGFLWVSIPTNASVCIALELLLHSAFALFRISHFCCFHAVHSNYFISISALKFGITLGMLLCFMIQLFNSICFTYSGLGFCLSIIEIANSCVFNC